MILRDAAVAVLKGRFAAGCHLDDVMASRLRTVSPAEDDCPAIYTVIGPGQLYTRRDGSAERHVKADEMGVACFFSDGRAMNDVFDLRELWNEVLTGQRQMSL